MSDRVTPVSVRHSPAGAAFHPGGRYPLRPSAHRSIIISAATMEGAGQVDVAIRCDKDGIPESCVVVAQGAEDALVRLRLRDAAATLLGIDTKQVAVYQRRKEGT